MTTAVSPSVGKGKNKTYDPYALRKSAKTPWGNPVVYFFSLLLVAEAADNDVQHRANAQRHKQQ